MKHKKGFAARFIAVVAVALAMVLGLAATALADDTYSITINNENTGHEYQVYQVFSGDLYGSTLSNIEWAAGVNSANLLTALKADATVGTDFATCTSAADVARVISGYTSNSDNLKTVAKIIGKNLSGTPVTATYDATSKKYVASDLSAGYYFIKDKDASLDNKQDEAYTEFILKLVANVTINPKSDVPESDKTVGDPHKTNANGHANGPVTVSPEAGDNLSGYTKTADYNIGDAVPFRLHGTVSDNIAQYDFYTYKFVDTQMLGLDPVNPNSETVIIANPVYSGSKLTGYTYFRVKTTGYTTSQTGNVYEVVIGATKTVKNADDEDVVIRDVKSLTTDHVEQVVWNTTTNTWDVVSPATATFAIKSDTEFIVTYTANLNKDIAVGGTFQPANNKAHVVYSNNPVDGWSTGNTPDDPTFVFSYGIKPTKVNAAGEKLSGAKFVLYRLGENDVPEYAVINETTGKVTWTADIEAATVRETGDDGIVAFNGLDVGTYFLKETKAPAGYNLLSNPIKVLITATYEQDASGYKIKTFKVAIDEGTPADGNKATAQAELNVENTAGNTLPETGGIGTMIFTAVGATLMAGAGITFVVKKRNENTEE